MDSNIEENHNDMPCVIIFCQLNLVIMKGIFMLYCIRDVGLATLGAGLHLELDTGNLFSIARDGAFCISENLLIFFFAGIGLDFCMKLGVVSPFPIDKSISNTSKI